MRILTFFLSFLVVQRGWASQLCDKDKGPSGTIDCLQFNGYHGQYQWGTCLTLARIQEKSAHDYITICGDRNRNYCWYQCMVEVHGQMNGSVADSCTCGPSDPSNSSSALPRQCFYPSGESCYWYRNCLEKKHPACKPSGNAYVIRYAERFCRVFEEQKAKLSYDTWYWMRAVRKCLQVAIVPLLNSANPTCDEIRKQALASYSQCYLNPGGGAKSICDIHCWQHFKIFWTIKGTFLRLDTAWESLKGLWNIGTQCTSPSIQEDCFKRNLKDVVKFFKLNVENLLRRKRRSPNSLSNFDILSRFTDGVGTAIASALNWNTDVMDWLAYATNLVSLGNIDIIIAMADKKALGIVTTPVASVDFNQTIYDFASAVTKGNLRPEVNGYNVWIKSLALCSDKSCGKTWSLAVSNEPPWSGSTRIHSHVNVGLFAVIAMLITLID